MILPRNVLSSALRISALLIGLVGFSATQVQGQGNLNARTSVIVGSVVDETGLPLANIEVSILPLSNTIRTRNDGTFRFDSLPIGRYSLRARGIGFMVQTQSAALTDSELRVRFKLERSAQFLSVFGVNANAVGLAGTIADTAYLPLTNANVAVLGSGLSTKTDVSGRFFLPVPPGSYLVAVQRNGYATQTIGVTIPVDEPRHIAISLLQITGKGDNSNNQALFDMGQRVLRASPASTHFFTREDLVALGIANLSELALKWADGAITPDCTVQIGGTRVQTPITSISTNDVEYVELYLPSKVMLDVERGVTSVNANPRKFVPKVASRPGPNPACGNLALIAWTGR